MSSSRHLVDRFIQFGRPNIVTADTPIADLRKRYADMFERFGPPPSAATFEAAQIGPLKGEWVRCPRSSPNRLILYFHGGGYIAGSPKSHRALIARLAQSAESTVFALNYRLAPEYGFPAAVRDGIDVYRHIMAKGVSPASVVFAGDGSGGGLAFAVLHAARNANLALPSGCIAMSPWADLSLSGWSMMKNAQSDQLLSWDLLFVSARHYLKKANPSDAYASPAFANFRGYPPIMVHAGSAEILRDDASRLGDRAADAGIAVSVEIYDGMQHLFQASEVAEAKVSLQRLGQFVRTRTAARQNAA